MTHKQNLLKKKKHTHTHKNKEEKYIPVIVWMVGLINTSNNAQKISRLNALGFNGLEVV